MNEFLDELKNLLQKHDASIVRSASEKNELVITVVNFDRTSVDRCFFDEVVFKEEISASDIAFGRYEFLNS